MKDLCLMKIIIAYISSASKNQPPNFFTFTKVKGHQDEECENEAPFVRPVSAAWTVDVGHTEDNPLSVNRFSSPSRVRNGLNH